MDDLQQLREFRADEASRTPDLDRARAALTEEIESAGVVPVRRRRAAPIGRKDAFPRRWAVLGAATVVLAGVLVAVFALPSNGPNEAQAALQRVALIAGSLPAERAPKRGQYLYTKSVRLLEPGFDASGQSGFDQFENPRLTFDEAARAGVAKYTIQLWAGDSAGAQPGRRITDRVGLFELAGLPIDPQARRKQWDRKIPIEDCGWPSGLRGCESGPHGQIYDPYGTRHSDIETEIGLIPPGPLAGEIYNDLSGLPSDPEALQDRLLKRAGAARLKRSGSTVVTFDIVSELLSTPGNYASPEVRQALYEVVAQLPDVDLVGEIKDPLGRRGLAVALTNNGIERQLIFDPNTSELLAREDVVADPEELGLDAKPGAVLRYTAFLVSGVADSLRERPSVNYLARSVPTGGP